MATKGTILVTGGTGYIGSHTTVEWSQAGYEVVSLDNLSTRWTATMSRPSKLSLRSIPTSRG